MAGRTNRSTYSSIRLRQRWSTSTRYATAAWSGAYGVLGLYWSVGGAGYPFGESGPGSQFSALAGVDADTGAPVIAVLGVAGTGVALTIGRCRIARPFRFMLLAFAWMVAGVLLLIVPDARALVAVAYAPVALVGGLIGRLPDDYRKAIPWPVLNQFVCVIGGLLWAGTAIAAQLTAARRLDATIEMPQYGGWTTPAAAARWGRRLTWVAAIIPLVYAVTRWIWALGFPLGLDPQLLATANRTSSGAWAGAVLGTMAIGGAALTLGLSHKWGETFPGWLPFLRGHAVPAALAIVPASIVAVLVTAAGLMFWRRTLLGAGTFTLSGRNWAALFPELLWPLWGVALGGATLAYHLRRREAVIPPVKAQSKE